MRTTISIPTDLMERLKKFDKDNPTRPMNHSAICRVALEAALDAEEDKNKKKHGKKGRDEE